MPELPTIAENGLVGHEAGTWVGVAAPANTPRPLVSRLRGELMRLLELQDVEQQFAPTGFDVIADTPGQFGEQITTDLAKWARVIREVRIAVD